MFTESCLLLPDSFGETQGPPWTLATSCHSLRPSGPCPSPGRALLSPCTPAARRPWVVSCWEGVLQGEDLEGLGAAVLNQLTLRRLLSAALLFIAVPHSGQSALVAGQVPMASVLWNLTLDVWGSGAPQHRHVHPIITLPLPGWAGDPGTVMRGARTAALLLHTDGPGVALRPHPMLISGRGSPEWSLVRAVAKPAVSFLHNVPPPLSVSG